MNIPAFRGYPVTKDSGFPWLGQVPSHWEVRPAKRALRPESSGGAIIKNTASQKPKDGYVPAFSASGQDIWLRSPSHRGDALVLSAVGARCGRTFRASGDWGVVANTHILRPEKDQNRDYWWYVTNNQDWWKRAGAAQPFVRVRTTLDRAWTYPGLEEQAAIVAFLDHADRRIQRYIRAKERLIELLEEQKQAIIHQAVTGQIDVRTGQPYPAYKDSGVEWLGEVPEHWEVVALKWVLNRLVDCEHKTAPAVDQSEYRVVRTTAVRGGSLRWDGTYCTSKEGFRDWTRRAEPAPGDVIFTREAPVGEACVVPEGTQVCLGQRTVLMRPNRREYDPDFLVDMIYEGPPRDHVRLATQGTTVGHFNMEDIGALWVLKPPYSEQRELVSGIGRQKRDLDLAVARTERQVGLLREYRTRLIADVVTGKLDVRKAAAALADTVPVGTAIRDTTPESEARPEVVPTPPHP